MMLIILMATHYACKYLESIKEKYRTRILSNQHQFTKHVQTLNKVKHLISLSYLRLFNLSFIQIHISIYSRLIIFTFANVI